MAHARRHVVERHAVNEQDLAGAHNPVDEEYLQKDEEHIFPPDRGNHHQHEGQKAQRDEEEDVAGHDVGLHWGVRHARQIVARGLEVREERGCEVDL